MSLFHDHETRESSLVSFNHYNKQHVDLFVSWIVVVVEPWRT